MWALLPRWNLHENQTELDIIAARNVYQILGALAQG
jgi:hypothetical protein